MSNSRTLILLRPGLLGAVVAGAICAGSLAAARTALAIDVQENPPEGVVTRTSGITVFSGWKCPIEGPITMTVDDGSPIVMASGTTRNDTRAPTGPCPTGDNGYGLLFNVNLFGEGTHTARFFDDGEEFAEATFEVTTFGESFAEGLEGAFIHENFNGFNLVIEWREGLQTFVIAAITPAEAIEVDSLGELLTAIATAPPGSRIRIAAGTYQVTSPIEIDRDDLIVEGVGDDTRFELADGANEPVFVIGDPDELNPTVTRRNIVLRRLFIDGNRAGQTQEVSDTPGREYLRNNCVDVRQADDVTLSDLEIARCRSGGVVLEKTCFRITLERIESYENFFDGAAVDGEVSDSRIIDCLFRDNDFAGLSFDIGPEDNEIRGCRMNDNGMVGLFISDSRGNLFADNTFNGNTDDGVFMRDGESFGAACMDNVFEDNEYRDNGRNGFWQSGMLSTGNRLEGGLFECNVDEDIEESFPGAPLIIGDPPTFLPCV